MVSEKLKERWTEERIAQLKLLAAEGCTMSEIAARIGLGFTRNAIIGKLRRLSIPHNSHNTGNGANPGGRPARPRKLRADPGLAPSQQTVKLVPPPPLRLAGVEDGRITVLHLSDKTCKWPIGDPLAPDFCFCGHPPKEGRPYCEPHDRMAAQPSAPRATPVTKYNRRSFNRSIHNAV